VAIEQQVAEVVARLVGSMDTTAQARAYGELPSVQMTTCELRPDAAMTVAHGVWLYQEQALTDRLSDPYRQRFLQVAPSADGVSVESRSFKPTQPELWIGLCDRPMTDRIVTTSDFEIVNCSVFLRRMDTVYIGETQPGGCPTNYQRAVRTTNTIYLWETGMDTSDRGFNAAGNQIWGSTDLPYQYRRLPGLNQQF